MPADRLRGLEGSPTLALAAKAKALAAAGKSVADFTAGEPDFPTPEPIAEAGHRAIREGRTRYTPVAGIPELREAAAKSLNATHGTRYGGADVLITCGAKHALYNIFQALCQAGDEVILPAPYWVSFPALIRLSGATPRILETREEDRFQPDPDAVQALVSPATKAILLNSPSNPTGTVIEESRLRAIARIAREHRLMVVSDEIYEHLVYPPAQHRSIVTTAPELRDQTLIVTGVSKTYSMTGWRIGAVAGPKPWIDTMTTLQSHSTSNPTSISQYAALAALTGDQAPVARMCQEFQHRRDRMVQGLNHLPGFQCLVPDGAFYAWCGIRGLGQPADALAARWLEEALVAVVPGEGFGAPNYVRFSFATSLDAIDDGMRRLAAWVKTHKPQPAAR